MDLKELEVKLTEQRASIETQLNKFAAETGDKAKAEVAALKSDLNEIAKTVNSVQEQLKVASAREVSGLRDQNKKTPFDFGMAVAAIYKEKQGAIKTEAWKDAGQELEMITQAIKLRSNYAGDGTSGGYLIPDEVTSEFVDLAMAQMPIVELGANVVRGLTGDLPIPKKSSRSTAYMVGENSKPTESQVAYSSITFRPKKIGAFTKQSNRLVYQSRGVSDKIIRDDLQYALKYKMEQQLLAGTGANYQAKGLLNTTGTTTSSVSLSGNRFKIDHAAQMITDLEVADELSAAGANCGFLMHPRVKAGMKRERIAQYSGQTSATGAPIMPMNLMMTDELLSNQLGYKIRSTSIVPNDETSGSSSTSSRVIFGNWGMFWIPMWRDLILKVSDVAGDGSTGSALLDDQIYIVMFAEFDCGIVRESAFTLASGASTTESEWTA